MLHTMVSRLEVTRTVKGKIEREMQQIRHRGNPPYKGGTYAWEL